MMLLVSVPMHLSRCQPLKKLPLEETLSIFSQFVSVCLHLRKLVFPKHAAPWRDVTLHWYVHPNCPNIQIQYGTEFMKFEA